MARKARWLGLLAAYRELNPREREAVDRALQRDPEARELKHRFDQQDALLASLDAPCMDPAVTERIMAATVARGNSARQAGLRPVLAAALTLLLLMMVGGTGVASSGSLPGDALYPVKRAGEEVRLALTLRDQAHARYAERLGEIRRQEVYTLLDLGRAGIAVEFEGPLEHSPTGEWMVAGVPILLPEEVGETPVATGSPVYVTGEIGQARVRVQTMRLLASSAVTAPRPAEPQSTREDAAPVEPGQMPGPPSRVPASASPQGDGRPSSAKATSTPAPTFTATPSPSATADGGHDRPKDSPADHVQPSKPTPPGEDKTWPMPPAPGPKRGEDGDAATGSQVPSSSGKAPAATPPSAAVKSPDGHPLPTRRPPHAAPPSQREPRTGPPNAPVTVGDVPGPPEGSAAAGSPAMPSSANENPISRGRP
jgi:hypothetical protein